VCLGYRCQRVGLRSRKTASTDASGSQVGGRTNPAPRRTRRWGTVPAALRSAGRLDLPPIRSRPPISRDASGFEPESLSRAGDQFGDGGEAAASVVVFGERRPVFQSRSNDSKSATGPRCVSLSGLKIALTLVIRPPAISSANTADQLLVSVEEEPSRAAVDLDAVTGPRAADPGATGR